MVDAAIDDSWCLKMSVLITVPSLDKGFGCRWVIGRDATTQVAHL
ncbi:hypothetical protein HMPREF9602_00759 [Cutibacterium acnes HL030PA2]|nr:hypothetical protein HMPREF9602_00759 [Cutibacterium acnes HL030PA2]